MPFGKTSKIDWVLGVLVLVLFLSPTMMRAQGESPEIASNTNPTRLDINPRNEQSAERQSSDETDCYHWACDQTEWDPYLAYEDLVDQGFARELGKREMEEGLVFLATRGAEIGTVAGELVGDPVQGAEIGVAIAIAWELIHSDYLLEPENPDAQRAVTRYERNLRKWDSKFSGCMKRKGYRVSSQ